MMVTNFLPGLVDLQDSVCDAWSQPQDPAKPTYQYVRGTIFFDMMKTGSALWPLARELEKSDHPNFPMDEDTVGKLYDEDQTPDYLVPRVFGTNEISLFFLQQIGMTYKSLTWMAMKQTGFDTNSLQAWFIAPFVTFFEKCEVTVEFIFFCVCWTRSVAALQGNGVLSRNISMAILHLYKLEDRLEEAMRGVTDQTLHVDLKVLQTVIRKTEVFNPGLRANPILTGCHLLDYHLKYISIMPQISPVALQLRAICHLYSALRDRKLLNEIPFFEDAIRVYEHVFFKPGRQQAIRGSYTKVYLMSTGMAESTVNDLLIGQGLTREQFLSRTRPDFQLPELSNVSRFLSQDFSSLPSELVKSGNWVALLDAVADCCTCELFDTRVLSRDFVKLSKDLADTFDCLWSILDWEDRGKFRVGNPPDKPIELKQVDEIVDKVMLPLLPLLDGMNSDGSLEFSVECINVFRRRGALQNTLAHALGSSGDNCETLLGFCRDMASQFVLRFGDSTALEKDYYTFPSTPDWITREFSGAKLCSERNPEQTAETFETLMKMMKSFDGPLQGDKLEEFKRLIKEDPDVLDLATPGSDIELCTLLHQAAAGRARDK